MAVRHKALREEYTMLTDDTFRRCRKTKWVCVFLSGDDKVWCGACQTTHYPEQMDPATEADMDGQISASNSNLKNSRKFF
jgi:hypothetical protein